MDLLHEIPAGDPKDIINVIIEIPMYSDTKYEYHPDLKMIVADRFLHTAMTYPFNYGFIPRTWSEDNDALDTVVLSSHPISTGTLAECRLLGMLETEDEEGMDAKVVAVPKGRTDPGFAHIASIDDLTQHQKDKIKHFYEHYKELESAKWVKVGRWLPKEEAVRTVEDCLTRYQEKFSRK